MPRLSLHCRALAGLVSLFATAPAAAFDTRVEPVWLEPPASVAHGGRPAMLTIPSGWQPGDAAVILLTGQPRHDAGRDRLMAALLADEAAILELDVVARRRAARRGSPGASDEPVRNDLREALRGLAEQSAPGLIVVVGWGEDGEAALGAATAAEAGLAAGVAMGPALPRFAAGAPVAAHEDWERRSRRLCALLADAAERGVEAPRAVAARCVAALEPRRFARAELR